MYVYPNRPHYPACIAYLRSVACEWLRGNKQKIRERLMKETEAWLTAPEPVKRKHVQITSLKLRNTRAVSVSWTFFQV